MSRPQRTSEQGSGERESVRPDRPDKARGGVSFWSVLTGVVVAFGAFIVLSAIISGVLAAVGVLEGGVSADEVVDAGVAVAIGFVVAQFLAYLWGGYTAGRMARGKGLINGLLVPIVAIVVVVVLGAVVAFVANTAADSVADNASVNADTPQVPLPLSELADIGTVAGVGLLIAMVVGGALGGMFGERWHTKLERRREAEAEARREAQPPPPPPVRRETTEAGTRSDADRDGVPDDEEDKEDKDTGSRRRT